jgi:nudix-type nucleoside diphosphatase (YffH/AdpP family)
MANASDLVHAFRTQAEACGRLGSSFMQGLLTQAATELERCGSISGVLADWPGNPVVDAVPLRLAAGLHALALSRADPGLAAAYSRGEGIEADESLWRAALAAVEAHPSTIDQFLRSPPQTNEVARSAVLLGGFLTIAEATGGRPMQMLEIGASAGLNLLWDRYHYSLGEGTTWGDPNSPVRIEAEWNGPLPPVESRIQVIARAASDVAPVNLGDADARLRLRAYTWADDHNRMALLDAATAKARQERVHVEKASAAEWVTHHLSVVPSDCTTVLYHSIAWRYFPDETKRDIFEALEAAGRHARLDARLAWLRLEPPEAGAPEEGQPELRLTMWPGGSEHRLALAQTHGAAVQWLGTRVLPGGGRTEREIQILKREVLSDHWYKLEKVIFDYPRRDGTHQQLTREVYHNGPGAAVLPFDPERRCVLLVRQFRITAALNGDTGRLIEACAGNIEDRDDPVETARKEAEQELGYRLRDVQKISELYVSPGASAEKLHLFIAHYSPQDRIGAGGGERSEGEETEVLEMPLSEAYKMAKSGGIVDAKTVLLLQYLWLMA